MKNTIKNDQSVVQNLRDAFWEKKKNRKLSPELKEIFKTPTEKATDKESPSKKKVARSRHNEAEV